jgi:hypothetical protein
MMFQRNIDAPQAGIVLATAPSSRCCAHPCHRISVTLAAAYCTCQNTEFCSADASTASKKAQRRSSAGLLTNFIELEAP